MLLEPGRLRVCVVTTLLGLLGVAAIVALRLVAMWFAGSQIDPYDDEEDQW